MENVLDILRPLFNFTKIEIIALLVLLLFFGIQLYYYLAHYRKILRYANREEDEKPNYTGSLPSVSVILCSMDDSENLKKCLPTILEQDYPSFEVIVVNDSFTEECQSLIHAYTKKYSNLYSTYIPADAKYLSRKKLSITIAAKASKNDILLFTEPNCYVEDKHWIQRMMQNFTTETEIVLGYSRMEKKKGYSNRLAAYDNLFSAMQYLGQAITNNPYRGIGRNLAYRKELFFRHKGFSKFLYLQVGEDDLFINQVATKNNTKVEVDVAGITTCNISRFDWKVQKMCNALTSGFYPKGIRYLFDFEVITRYIFYALFIGIVTLSSLLYFAWMVAVIAGIIFITRFIIQLKTINKTAAKLKDRKFYTSILYFDLMLPIINSYYKLYRKFGGKKDYTYSYNS